MTENKFSFNHEIIQKKWDVNPFMKITDIVYEVLEKAIMTTELAPGTRININKISKELGVSNSPVRDAVERLIGKGMIIRIDDKDRKHKSYYVFDLNKKEIADLFTARSAIECVAASICAQDNWRLDMRIMDDLNKDFTESLSTFGSDSQQAMMLASEYDRKFHRLIINGAKNNYLLQMYETIEIQLKYLSIRTCEYMTRSPNANVQQLVSQHRAIYNAINLGFPDLARSVMDKHIQFCSNNCLIQKKDGE